MLKKLFAAIVAATMVLGLASFATAATPSFPDTVGIPEETQIATLKALGIVTGDEQGRFNPDGTFTRAQMAVIAVKLMGLDSMAKWFQQPTMFPDVEARHSWAWGYINVAVGQQIVTGRPDGTFGPDDPATYTDVIVLLLRVLNYEPTLVGTWPTKYLVKAAEIGLAKGVSFNALLPATRRDVAVLAHNALTIPKVVQVGFGTQTKWVVSGTPEYPETVTLLDNLGSKPIEGWLVSSPELFGAEKDVIKVDTPDGEKEFTLAEGVDVTGLLGHKVKIWQNSEGKVFLVQDKTPASSVKTAAFVDENTVEIDDKAVSVAETPKFLNYEGPEDYDLVDGGEITVIYDGNNPKYVIELKYTTAVVTGISTLYDTVTLDPSGVKNLTDKNVRWFGDAEELSDLRKDDVVQFIEGTEGKDFVFIVTRNAPTGKFTKIQGSTITVGGVAYKRALDQTAAPSEGLLGQEVKVLLNKDGRWWAIVALEGQAAPKNIAVVLDKIEDVMTIDGLQDYLKLLLPDGTKKVFPCSQEAFDAVDENDIIEYAVTDGVIKDRPNEKIASDATAIGLTVTVEYHLVNGKLVTPSTAIFDMSGTTPKAGTWDTLVAKASGMKGVMTSEGSKAVIIKITQGAPELGKAQYGVYMGKYVAFDPTANEPKTYYSILERDGTVRDYVYNSGPTLAAGNAVTFTVTGGKADFTKLDDEVPVPTEGYEWRVYSIEGYLLTLKEYNKTTGAEGTREVSYLIIDKTQYVDLTGSVPRHITGVSQGAKVRVYSVDDPIGGTVVANIIAVIK
ncbi:MAG TPA: S-layer homology domain-containing protein [Firmicutes bacterium]|nr:S-layer homology domain-containing protein [Candidatus Fermentithermobacillaceae bacterium]